MSDLEVLLRIARSPAAWEFEFDDGRRITIYEQIFGSARACLMDSTGLGHYDAW